MTSTIHTHADTLAKSFAEQIRVLGAWPFTPHKVLLLGVVRETLGVIKGLAEEGIISLDNLPAVERDLQGIEAQCSALGLFDLVAQLSRPARRRLHRECGVAQ